MLRRILTDVLLAAAALALAAIAAFFFLGAYEMPSIAAQARNALWNVNLATAAIGSETATEEKLLQQQTKAFSTTTARANAAFDALGAEGRKLGRLTDAGSRLVAHLDKQVNGQALPALTAELGALRAATDAFGAQARALAPAVRSTNASAASVARFTATLPATGRSLVQTSANLARGTRSLAGVAADAKTEADKLVAPLTWPKRILHDLWTALKTAFYAKGVF